MKKLFAITLLVSSLFFWSCNGKKAEVPKPAISENATTQEKIEFYAKNSQDKDELKKVEINGLNQEIAHIKYNQSLWHSEDVYLKELCYVYPNVTKDVFDNCPEIQTIVFWFMIDENLTLVRCELSRNLFNKIADMNQYKVNCTLDYNKFIDTVDSVYINPQIKAKLTKLTSKRKTN